MHDMRWSEASDDALLDATRRYPDAFAELYDRYEAALVGYLLRRTGDVEVAVDLASEDFAAALASQSDCATRLLEDQREAVRTRLEETA